MEHVIIGVDPHKLLATIEVVDHHEKLLGSGRFTTDQAGYAAMREYVEPWPDRVWAVEGSNGAGRQHVVVVGVLWLEQSIRHGMSAEKPARHPHSETKGRFVEGSRSSPFDERPAGQDDELLEPAAICVGGSACEAHQCGGRGCPALT